MITDELREWAHNRVAEFNIGGVDGRDLLAIADRIDAEHRAALEKLAAMVDDGSDQYLEGFNYAMDHLADEMNKLMRRVECLERLLNHKGGAE